MDTRKCDNPICSFTYHRKKCPELCPDCRVNLGNNKFCQHFTFNKMHHY